MAGFRRSHFRPGRPGWLRPQLAWLAVCQGLSGALLLPGEAVADDWQVSRSEFDPRVIGALKAELRRRPEDLALLRRLLGLYRRYRSVDALVGELREQAQAERASGWDAYLVAGAERERGHLDDASRWLETARERVRAGRPGPDGVKLSLAQSDLSLKKAPPDLKGAAGHIRAALADSKPGDAGRRALLRRLADLQGQGGDLVGAEASLRELLSTAAGAEALTLRRELGETLARGGKPKEALAEWRQLEKSYGPAGDASRRADAKLHIGELCEATQDDLGALAAYREALAALPGQHPQRREVLEHLIALQRKRGELPALIAQLEKERPAAARSFADWELFARLYDERGDTPAAISAYRQALRREPHSVDIRRRLIALLERSGAAAEVLREYEALITQIPGDARPYLELAERLERAGQRAQALAWLRRAAGRFGGDASLHSALCDLYQRWGENDLALAEAELLVRLDPRDESHLLTLGELYWVRGKKDKADEIWRRLLSLFPSRALGQARLADVYAEHNLMNEALDLYQKAVKAEPQNLQIKRGLAQSLERLSRPKDAVATWEQIYFAASQPSDRPLRLEARQHLGKLLRKETRLLPTLYSWQRRLAAQLSQLVPDRMQPAELVALAVLVADVSLALGQIGDAEAALLQIRGRLPPGPLLAEVLLALSAIYQQQHKLDEAIAVLKQAAALLPERQRELQALLAELSLQSYRDEDAVRYARQAVVDGDGELRLGEILEKRDDIAGAMAAYKRAIELDSRLFRAHMALARLHMGRGELADAATSFRDVVRRATQDDMILEAGRRAIDIHEYLGTLGELSRDLAPLAYAPVSSATLRTTYRKLLLLLYERYALPLHVLSRMGDAAATAELRRLGAGSIKPLTETLVDGDQREQRLAVVLLAAMQPPSAVLSLLNLAMLGEPEVGGDAARERAARPGAGERRPAAEAGRESSRVGGPRSVDIDLRVDALMVVAHLADSPGEGSEPSTGQTAAARNNNNPLREPRSVAQLVRLAQSREKQVRLAALYALARAAGRLPPPAARPVPGTPDGGAFALAFENTLLDSLGNPSLRAMAWLGLGELGASGRAWSPRVRAQALSQLSRYRQNADSYDVTEEPALAALIHAIGRTRDRSFVPQLIEILAAGNDGVLRQAAWALGAMPDPRALQPLLRAVFTRRDPVRQVAAAALGQLAAPASSSAGAASGSPAVAARPAEPAAAGGPALSALPAVELEPGMVVDLDGASLTPQAIGARPIAFVDRLLLASTGLPKPVPAPLWLDDPAALTGALESALLSHRDTAARTLADLLADADPPRGDVSHASAATARAAGLVVAPLGEGRSALPTAFAVRLGQGLLPTLRRLALAQLPQSVAGQKPQLGGELDLSLRAQALQLLGRLADLPTGAEAGLTQDAGQVLLSATGLESAELALPALEQLCRPRPGGKNPSELAAISETVLARFLGSRERSLRVAAMGTASRLAALDRRLLPTAALRRASEDSDGYVRDSAQKLLVGAR
jgi:tetratricopeptide (TPR) repeat protein